jgi:putative endonuclease
MEWVYILRCSDGTLYVGRTSNLTGRVQTHNEGRGGAYTAKRRPVRLLYSESHETVARASGNAS